MSGRREAEGGSQVECPKCGAHVDDGDLFCVLCGTQVSSSGSTATVIRQPSETVIGRPAETVIGQATETVIQQPAATAYAPPPPMPPVSQPPAYQQPAPPAYQAPAYQQPSAPVPKSSGGNGGVIAAVVIGVVMVLAAAAGTLAWRAGAFSRSTRPKTTTTATGAGASSTATSSAKTGPGLGTGSTGRGLAKTPGAAAPAAPAAKLPPVTTPAKDTPERKALMDAARTAFGTSSQFYVNQLYVQGRVAVGDIGAVQGGPRVWVVWNGDPWTVVFAGTYGEVDEQTMRADAPGITADLLRSIDWTKAWPEDFVFQ